MTRKLVVGLAALAVLGAVGYGVYAWIFSRSHIWTDDAYVEGTIAQVSAKVSGYVAELLVDDNQAVKVGDLILRLDPRDYQAKRDQVQAAAAVAEAVLRSAGSEVPLARELSRAQSDEARASLEAARGAERAAESGVAEVVARVESRRAAVLAMQADVQGAVGTARQTSRELERVRQLAKGGYVAERDVDQAEAAASSASSTLEATRRRLSQAEKEVDQAQAELLSRRHAMAQARERALEALAALARADSQRHTIPVKEAEVVRAEARVRETRADLALAELQLSYTELRAPVDGVVAKKTVELGQVVQVGQPLMAIVPLHAVWVVANFKETQLSRVRPGQTAWVEVDTFPGKALNGVVESISAGTGSRFSLLPPENATGNWVKVVQRVPVKIRLTAREIGNPQPLRAGMSVAVTIKVN